LIFQSEYSNPDQTDSIGTKDYPIKKVELTHFIYILVFEIKGM